MFADNKIQTNKKLAILHDSGPDGQVGGNAAAAIAKQYGYEVVTNSSFPVDNSQFTSTIGQMRSIGADTAIVFAITPQAILIRKQMAAGGYTPKVLVIEKGGETQDFARALGKLSDGVITSGYWDPTFPYPGAAALAKRFESETQHASSQHIADSNTAARVLLDAIAATGSLDRDNINAAIAKTNKIYAVIWPKERENGKLIFPLP